MKLIIMSSLSDADKETLKLNIGIESTFLIILAFNKIHEFGIVWL